MTSDTELRALLRLLDDPDPVVQAAVRARIGGLDDGDQVRLTHLASALPPLVQATLRTWVAERIDRQLLDIFAAFGRESARPGTPRVDLEVGAFAVARFGYPHLDVNPYRRALDELAAELSDRLEAKGVRTDSIRAVPIINRFLFYEQGFLGNRLHYDEPDNSYLNQLIDRRLGIPISLSVLYLLIARERLGLDIHGVGMPTHFLLMCPGPDGSARLFDPFTGGQSLTREQCIAFLAKSGIHYDPSYLSPATDREIVTRMLRNLHVRYSQLHDDHRVERLTRYLHAIDPNAVEPSDLSDEPGDDEDEG